MVSYETVLPHLMHFGSKIATDPRRRRRKLTLSGNVARSRNLRRRRAAVIESAAIGEFVFRRQGKTGWGHDEKNSRGECVFRNAAKPRRHLSTAPSAVIRPFQENDQIEPLQTFGHLTSLTSECVNHRQSCPDRGTLGRSSTNRDYRMSTYVSQALMPDSAPSVNSSHPFLDEGRKRDRYVEAKVHKNLPIRAGPTREVTRPSQPFSRLLHSL